MSDHHQYWSSISTAYDQSVEEAGDESQRLIINPIVEKFLGDVSNQTILDAGCGNGYWSRKLSKTAKKVVGIDFTNELIARANERGVPANVIFLVGNLENLPFESNLFDTVLLNMVLMDVENLTKVVSEISRVIRLGGSVIVSITHPCFENPPNTNSLKDDQGNTTARVVSNYFSTGLIVNEPNHYQHYHYTLSQYINCFTQNSFLVENMEEPNGSVITNSDYTDQIPYFLIIKLAKSGEK